MKQKAKQLIYLLIAFVALAPGLQAADYSINDFRLGEVVHGDSERMNDLEGKVIVIDFWGVQCGPCIKKMPHLVELDRKYADKGLRIVGAEMQRSRTNRIMSIVKKKNVTFPITRGCANPIRVNRLPHMAIFGVDGKLVYHGYPDSNVDTIILKELEKVVPATEHVITDIR
ncbi:MAG: TlpA disulfide reductase family protein [Verrucomicrobiales bacterium]|nr:TlpA disulfide reductase family protein [Verrucomicrobiales bacterium]